MRKKCFDSLFGNKKSKKRIFDYFVPLEVCLDLKDVCNTKVLVMKIETQLGPKDEKQTWYPVGLFSFQTLNNN